MREVQTTEYLAAKAKNKLQFHKKKMEELYVK